jgi:hypothetical protein
MKPRGKPTDDTTNHSNKHQRRAVWLLRRLVSRKLVVDEVRTRIDELQEV